MEDGFIRVCAATPEIKVADCDFNSKNIIDLVKEAEKNGASLVVFPELCVTGYTCGDLFLQKALLDSAEKSLLIIAEETAALDIISIVGLPLRKDNVLLNCGVVIYHGEILGAVPKQYIPNYSEFYEARHFASGKRYDFTDFKIGEKSYPLSCSIIFSCKNISNFSFGIEICEDLWVINPPSNYLSENGALIICNLSASDEVIGKAEYRRSLIKNQSARLISGYIYADAGMGESSTDMVFAGHNLIAENGAILSESKKFTTGITYSDLDLDRLSSERRRMTTFKNAADKKPLICEFDFTVKAIGLTRKFYPSPFVPSDKKDLAARCEDILTMQASGLATRLKHTNSKNVVLGLSGGLDSTLALIVCVHAFDILNLDKKGITTVTMPCFGTTSRTKNNACELAEAYGVTLRDINIKKAVLQHFEDIGQPDNVQNVTYENSQARERTQILMDIANQLGGLVVGTGDLSELSLGWATYNGDHMSMYAVNASIPKTLVRHLTAYEAGRSDGKLKSVLLDVLDTPVSPELLPPKDGEISQKTEELVGPYELHDFFLYYFMRFGFPPKKILRIAKLAFDGIYTEDVIKKWLEVFIKRFFSQQFKRSCLPDGPKVGTVTLSPRGDFRMPSDAVCRIWLDNLNL